MSKLIDDTYSLLWTAILHVDKFPSKNLSCKKKAAELFCAMQSCETQCFPFLPLMFASVTILLIVFSSLTVGRHRQGGITTLVGKSCRQKAPITAPTPGGTSHQGNKLNAMAHILVGAPVGVKLVRSASDPELETVGLWILKLSPTSMTMTRHCLKNRSFCEDWIVNSHRSSPECC